MRVLIAFLAILATPSALGQVPGAKEFQLPPPEIHSKIYKPLATPAQPLQPPAVGTFSVSDADELASALVAQFQLFDKWNTSPAPVCDDREALNYTLSLHIRGDYSACAAYASKCAPSAPDPRVILRGALCAAGIYDFPTADKLFEDAAAPRFKSLPEYEEVLLQYASYALFGNLENQVESILARHPSWNLEERRSWEGVLRRLGSIQITDLTEEEVDRFLDSKIPSKTGTFQALLKHIKMSISMNDFRYTDALSQLKEFAPSLKNPLLWYAIAYNALYYGLDQDFALARKIYDAYDPYAHKWSWLPNENNTYNYSQIYSEACTESLSQGEAFTELQAVKSNIQRGALSAQQALNALSALNVRFEDKADVLTAIGGMYSMLERHEEAIASYWKAHRLCRYYNRANWGLLLERRFAKYSKMTDYQKNLERIARELSGLTLPSEMSKYIVNWNSLGTEARRRVYYGNRIWLPYVKMLSENGRQAYIKLAFELLSEAPGMSYIRDQRVSNTPNDNRLWDDVRGLGGDTVIADLSEVMQTVHGDYNLLGHEVAHQFEFLMAEFHEPGFQCIVRLYDKARAEKNFPDAYSAGNKEEHFAQLVTYYLVPADSPKRFGLNRRWLETNDVPALEFIQSIELSQGNISHITCPL